MIWYVCYSIISLKNIHHALLLLTNVTPRKNITMSWSRSRKPALEFLYGYIFAPWRDGSPDLIWEEEGDTITIITSCPYSFVPSTTSAWYLLVVYTHPRTTWNTLSYSFQSYKNNIPWQRSSRVAPPTRTCYIPLSAAASWYVMHEPWTWWYSCLDMVCNSIFP